MLNVRFMFMSSAVFVALFTGVFENNSFSFVAAPIRMSILSIILTEPSDERGLYYVVISFITLPIDLDVLLRLKSSSDRKEHGLV